MEIQKIVKFAPWLLLVGGAVHMLPSLNRFLTNLTGGTSYIQIVVGALSILVALLMFKK